MKGIVGFLIGKENLLDHLGIFCQTYDIPLKVFDPALCSIAKTWYPNLDVELSDFSPHDLDPAIYPWILSGTLSSIEPLREAQLQLFGKTSSFAYLPHGISAKSREWKKEQMPMIDLFLFPGAALRELIQECELDSCYRASIYTGNFRGPYFEQHHLFYHELTKSSKNKPSLLLMPSCSSPGSPSFFFDLTLPLLEKLQTKFTLLIKPHPLLEEERPGFYWQLSEICKEAEITFLDKVPLVLPYLGKASLLVTDTSSVVFDGLAQGSKVVLLRKPSSINRYDLSDQATRIDHLEQLLDDPFEIPHFDAQFRQEKLDWLYSPLLKKSDLEKALQLTLQPTLE